MTAFAHTSALPRAPRRALVLVLLTLLASSLTALLAAPAAHAVVEEVGGTQVGLQPRASFYSFEDGAAGGEFANPAGHPVIPAPNVFVVYWDPSDLYHPEWQRLIDTFAHNVGEVSGNFSSLFDLDTQYTDRHNEGAAYKTTFRGAYTDTHAFPSPAGCKDPQAPPRAVTCLSDAQIREQLQSFITQRGLPTGMSDVYYLLTPPGVTVCLSATSCSDYVRPARTLFAGKFEQEIFSFQSYKKETVSNQEKEALTSSSYEHSFCSYHSAINPGANPEGSAGTILYATIPWVAGSAGERAQLHREEIEWGYECQDGGFTPNARGNITREHPALETEEEENAFAKGGFEEKLELLEAKERETPHMQQPEQVGLGEDGMYDTGLADVIINQISVEQQDIVTDPLLDAWQGASDHYEAADECRDDFAVGNMAGSEVAQADTNAGTLSNQSYSGVPYYLNDAFNLAASKLSSYGVPCRGGISLVPHFTAPNPVKVSEVIGLDGMESDITLNAGTRYSASGTPEAVYAWYWWTAKKVKSTEGELKLGEGYAPGAPTCEEPWDKPCAASEYSTFTQPGEYEVTLRVRDVGGNEASVTHNITVLPAGTPGESYTGVVIPVAGAGSTPSATPPGGSTAAAIPAPVARAAVVSHSLSEALSRGLAVLYNVNEQVAGHFEVLLSTKLAHKFGISGAPALDLPAGSQAMTVIAKALLVTLKGGSSAVHIKFSKQTAKKLARMKKVSFELRLIVHNSAAHPLTTVFATVVTLGPAKHVSKKQKKHSK